MTPDRKKAKTPTIAEVARLAGVSKAVASRALSKKKRPVSEKNKTKVLEAAAQLGYIPNPFAQSLATRETDIVSVVVNHIGDISDLDLFDRLIECLQRFGKQVTIVRLQSIEAKREFMHSSLNYHVDAALIFSDFLTPSEARDYFKTEKVIMLNGKYDEKSFAVFPDDESGIKEAIEHANLKNVRTAAIVTGRSTNQLEARRIELFYMYLHKYDVIAKEINAGDYSYESGEQVGMQLLKEPYPDAIFCTSDSLAMGIFDTLTRDHKLSIPDNTLLFGFDDAALANALKYGISTIAYDKNEYVEIIASIVASSDSSRPFGSQQSIRTKFLKKVTA